MKRPDQEREARILGLTASTLTDAVGRRYDHKAHVSGLVSPTPERRLFGPAVTIRFLPRRADVEDMTHHNFAKLFHEAIGGNGGGRVLVLSSSGYLGTSVGGGTKLSRLHNLGLAGVITDGCLRDFSEFQAYDFSAWCADEAVHWGGDALVPYEANVPVTIRDITVMPGDYVFADRSAAVIIPPDGIDEVIEEALRIQQEDRRFLEEIQNEDPKEILKKGSGET